MKSRINDKTSEDNVLRHFWVVLSAPLEDEKGSNEDSFQKSRSYNRLNFFGTIRPWVN